MDGVAAWKFESAESAKLSIEFQCALTAIAAVGFAMDALSKELEGAGHTLDTSQFTKPLRTNAGFFIAHRLIQAFGLKGGSAAALPTRMETLFGLRNDSVHFESEYRQGAHLHPSGTNTAYELTVYTLEQSVTMIQLGLDVIRECAESVKTGNYDKAAKGAANELPGVLAMLNEVVRVEGLRGLT